MNRLSLITSFYRTVSKYYYLFLNSRKLASIAPDKREIQKAWGSRVLRCSAIEQYEEECGYRINDGFLDNLARVTQLTLKDSYINYLHGRVLYSSICARLERQTENEDRFCYLEIGTGRGFSMVCAAKAFRSQEKEFFGLSIDILPHAKAMLWNTEGDESGKRTRRDLLHRWQSLLDTTVFIQGDSVTVLKSIGLDRCHFAFVDGCHEYEVVKEELSIIKSFQYTGDQILLDDYDAKRFPGAVRAIDESLSSGAYSTKVIFGIDGRNYYLAQKI